MEKPGLTRRVVLASAVSPLVGPLVRPTASQRRSSAESRWLAGKRFVTIYGRRMAYVDRPARRGAAMAPLTFVFLHGNPTSSYLWRKIVPAANELGRCVAPDLIGMGDSDKLTPSGAYRYRFAEHRDFLEALLDAVNVGPRVCLVLHDWGGMLGFDWARRHPDRVVGLAHMETVMAGLDRATAPAPAVAFFQRYHTEAGAGDVLERNQFVEEVLIKGLGTLLDDEDRAEYRRPYHEPGESRRPTLAWPQAMPIDGQPSDTSDVFAQCRDWLAQSQEPKLFVNAEPGALIADASRKATCRSWPQTTEVTVKGTHFVQEQAPSDIAAALLSWARTLS